MNNKSLKKLKGKYSEELIVRFDNYLSTVRNSFKDRLHIHQIIRDMRIDNSDTNELAEILEDCCDLGILKRRYAILCPECNLALVLTDEDEVEKRMEELNYCYGCELGSEDLDLKVGRDSLKLLYGIKD